MRSQETFDFDTVVVGSGPAGLFAAIHAHAAGGKTLVLEKAVSPALKLRITGKGRCNITNEAPLRDFVARFGKNGRFLRYAFSEFFSKDLLAFFEELGVPCKLERGGRYFPESDKALDFVFALLKKAKELGITIEESSAAVHIRKEEEGGFVLSVKKGRHPDSPKVRVRCKHVVLATGGLSYPKTGSTGDGYRFARELGHTIIPPMPSLVPIDTSGPVAARLQGLSLKNVNVRVVCGGKTAAQMQGEMIFTDSGVSGPVILTLSREVVKLLQEGKKVDISIDLKPALEHDVLDRRLLREIEEHGKQDFKNMLKTLLPQSLIPVFIDLMGISGEKECSHLTAAERKKLRLLLKEFVFQVKGHRPVSEAIVTAGGVSIKEVSSSTMESKIVPGLYFAGEVLDLDADTGGYNLQMAFSTGWVAGTAIRNSPSH